MLSIKNWAKFQHFKDRSPPWIKLYRDLLDDLQWHKLDPAASKVLVMLWLIASENDGNLPDIEEIAFRLRMPEPDVLALLPKLSHWIEGEWGEAISPRYHDDTPGDIKPIPLARSRETEAEGETEEEAEREGEAAQARPATDPPPKRQARGSRFCPDSFEPDDELIGWARREHPTVDVARETELFRDHEFAKPITDWRRAWRRWIRNAETFSRTAAPRKGGPSRRETTAEHNDRAFDEWMAGTDDGRTIDA